MQWIVTDNIYTETWRRLLEFSNTELANEKIAQWHGAASSKSQRNDYKKQATQARVCVLQAKEYFDAARSVSIFTSPNHSYYGAVALASLMMLIIGDGTKSLDYLRKDNRNKHHGLELTIGCSANTASSGINLVEQTHVTVLSNGHFGNWYKTLPPYGPVSALVINLNKTTSSINRESVGTYSVINFNNLIGSNKSILDLLKYLPDINEMLDRFSISPVKSRSSHEVTKKNDGNTVHEWIFHNFKSENNRDILLGDFLIKPQLSNSISCLETNSKASAIVSLELNDTEKTNFHWPGSRDTLSHDTISYAGITESHEIVDLYMVAYMLSMLSRYFPDIWISCMESQCRAAKLIERVIEVIIKKLPILALSMLHGEEIVISTHRAPWKS